MRNLITLIFLGSCLLFPNCKKITEQWPKTVVEGKVFDVFTGEPLVGAYVHIERLNYEENLGGSITDQDGNYKIEFHCKPEYTELWLDVQSKFYNRGHDLKNMRRGKRNLFDVTAAASSGLDFRVHNVNPFDENDKIVYHRDFPGIGLGENSYVGRTIDILSHKNAYGNTFCKYSWEVTKNGLTSSFNDSIFIPVDHSAEFTINY